jgi:Xaa-Pro dipeptidase
VLTREKLAQAVPLVKQADVDVWLTFVRETAQGGDPVLPLILEGGLTWQSALLVYPSGRKVAIVGNYDADPLVASGDWDVVVPYVQGIRSALLEELENWIPDRAGAPARIAVNFSEDDDKADGLSHGMFRCLEGYFAGTRFEGSLVSSAAVTSRLRAQKTPSEVAAMRKAIAETDVLFGEIAAFAKVGVSERAIQDYVHGLIDQRGFGYGWDRAGNPIVNSGPDSMVGHGIPSPEITLQPGHIFHIDLGVICDGYSSDIQRCWYVSGGEDVPADALAAMAAVNGAISAGAAVLRPGVLGWEVDAAARSFLVSQGYPEYMHALGHQVGRLAHDGGSLLGPRWERYGRSPVTPIEANEVYTLELGVMVEGRGYLGIEEMVRVTEDGVEWLSERQLAMPTL